MQPCQRYSHVYFLRFYAWLFLAVLCMVISWKSICFEDLPWHHPTHYVNPIHLRTVFSRKSLTTSVGIEHVWAASVINCDYIWPHAFFLNFGSVLNWDYICGLLVVWVPGTMYGEGICLGCFPLAVSAPYTSPVHLSGARHEGQMFLSGNAW